MRAGLALIAAVVARGRSAAVRSAAQATRTVPAARRRGAGDWTRAPSRWPSRLARRLRAGRRPAARRARPGASAFEATNDGTVAPRARGRRPGRPGAHARAATRRAHDAHRPPAAGHVQVVLPDRRPRAARDGRAACASRSDAAALRRRRSRARRAAPRAARRRRARRAAAPRRSRGRARVLEQRVDGARTPPAPRGGAGSASTSASSSRA